MARASRDRSSRPGRSLPPQSDLPKHPMADPNHKPNQFTLLRQRRFAPFFWTQFLGAANDNIYKNALIIFVAYQAAAHAAFDANTLVNLAAGIFILPFVLLSATAGQLADKYENARLI